MENPFDRLEQRLINIENLLKQSHSNEGAVVTAPREIIDSKTLCLRLGITEPTLIKWRNRKKVPFLKLGGSIRYDWNQVCDALNGTNKKG